MQLFFSLWGDRRGCLERIERFFSLEHAAVFFQDRRGCFGAKLSYFSASNMQLFFSKIEEAALVFSLEAALERS